MVAKRMRELAEEMEEAVEHQDFDFGGDVVAEAGGLFEGTVGGDGHFAEFGFAGEAEDIGGVIVLEEGQIKPVEFLVVRDQNGERLTCGEFGREAGGKSTETGFVERNGPFDALE